MDAQRPATQGVTRRSSKGQGPIASGRPASQGLKSSQFTPAERFPKGQPAGRDEHGTQTMGLNVAAHTLKKNLDSARSQEDERIVVSGKREVLPRSARGGDKAGGSSGSRKRHSKTLIKLPSIGAAHAEAVDDVRRTPAIHSATKCDEASKHLVDLRREALTKQLKVRRDQAFAAFETTSRSAHAECEVRSREDLKRLRNDLAMGDDAVEETFASVVRLGDGIRNYKRGDVDAILHKVVGLCQEQQLRIDEFTDMGHSLEEQRRAAVEGALRGFVDETRDIIPIRGEVQRAVDKRGHDLNELTQLNRKAVSDITCRLQSAGLEKQKICKRRWHNDVLLTWRAQSHRLAIAEVLERIVGEGRMEFVNPDILVQLFERLQEIQKELWETRSQRALSALTAGVGKINSKDVKQMQEELGNINEKYQDQFTKVFHEFKTVKDAISNKTTHMLKELADQLKELDARQEWHGHNSVDALLRAELQPKVDANLQFVNNLMMRCSQDLQVLDDVQHNSTVNLLQFIIKSAEASEKFRATVIDYQEMEIDGAWQDMLEDHEDEKQQHADTLKEIQIEIEQAVDVPQLDDLAHKAFDHLDVMAQAHYDFYTRQTDFLGALREQTDNFFLQKVETFLQIFGLRSMHGLAGWEPPQPPEELPPPPPPAEEGAEPVEEVQVEVEEKEKPPPEPKLTDVQVLAGIFEVVHASIPEANGAYVNYMAPSTPSKKRASKTDKKNKKDEFKFPNTFTNVCHPQFEIKFAEREWSLCKKRHEDDVKIHIAPKDIFFNADLRKCIPITEGEEEAASTAVRGQWALPGKEVEAAAPKKGKGADPVEEQAPPASAEIVWRPLCEGELGPPNWSIGSLFTDRSEAELVRDLVRPPEEKDAGDVDGGVEADAEAVEDAPAEEAKHPGEGTAESNDEEEKTRVPHGADGKPCLMVLEYTIETVRKLVDEVRTGTMSAISKRHKELTTSLDEKIKERSADAENTLFDQRRRHVSRRGVVQVEWYAPRKGVVERHKESFQRLLHGIAGQVQKLDKTFEQVKEDFVAARAEHEATLTELTTRFAEATSVAQFSRIEREGEESKRSLDAKRKKFMDQVLYIAGHELDGIRENGKHFLARCHVPVEQYSAPELKIYKKEVAVLASQLKERGETWRAWVQEQDSQDVLDELNQPLLVFDEQVHEAIEKLSEEKGLGRKHGVVRRAMQQQLQTLMSYSTSSLHHLHSLVEWCAHAGEGYIPAGVDPEVRSRVAAALNTHRPRRGEPWPVALEVRALLTVIGLAVRLTGGFLTAWKPEHDQNFEVDKFPKVCFVREDVALGGAEAVGGAGANGMEALKKKEDAFKHEVIIDLFGRIRKSEPLAVEAKKVRESVSVHYKGAVPQFMEAYLAHTHKLEHSHRLHLSVELRDLASGLRGGILCDVVARAFTDLVRRQQEALEAACKEAERKSNEALSGTSERRRGLDAQLRPELARPNMAHILEELCVEEKARHKEAKQALKGVRINLGEVFRSQAKAFLKSLVAQFEAIVTLVDALPLPVHFAKLEGDETTNGHTEEEREEVSLKRRMRRQAGSRRPEEGALPPRVWQGVPMDEIRVNEKLWPEDEEAKRRAAEAAAAAEAEAAAAAKKRGSIVKGKTKKEEEMIAADAPQTSPAISSYRSPLHKQLFKSRNECYEQFCKVFHDAMSERHTHWSSREAQEQDLVRSWRLNIQQLKRHSEADEEAEEDSDEDGEKKQEKQEEPPPPDPQQGKKK